jgi:DNA polymerase (family 10)
MSTNAEVARILNEIADLLDLAGEKFKPDAYRRAARSVESLGEDLRRISDRGELDEIPGIGEAIAEKIREYLKTGRLEYYERLRQRFPPGILEIMQIPGVGPKTARRFLLELRVEGPKELADALEAGRLRGVHGFGERKIEQLREGLKTLGAAVDGGGGSRVPILVAWELAEKIVRDLRERAPVRDIAVAGSLRRRRETVGDLDLLITSDDIPKVFDVFSSLPEVKDVRLRGETKETILYGPAGTQVDLRVVEPASFGAALQYFTGSKDHNIHLRSIARDRGLKINEYGVFRGEERIAGATEEEVYATLGLPAIAPEIRENRGEIEAAQRHALPRLVGAEDLRGELHVHLPGAELSAADAGRWISAARERGYGYLGFVLEGRDRESDSAEAARNLRRALPGAAAGGSARAPGDLEIWIGLEVPVGGDRPPPARLPEGIDYWVARPAPASEPEPLSAPPRSIPETRPPLFVGHVSRERDSAHARPSYAERFQAWLDWAGEGESAFEVTPFTSDDGLDSGGVRHATGRGVRVLLTARPEAPEGLARTEIPLGIARRGWAEPKHVLNADERPGGVPPARTPTSSAKATTNRSRRR